MLRLLKPIIRPPSGGAPRCVPIKRGRTMLIAPERGSFGYVVNDLMSDDRSADARRQIGRPTKCTGKTLARVYAAIAEGMPINGACVVAGIGVTTLKEWRERFPNLEERITDAREHARLRALQAIKAAGDKDWRAWAEWLKLTHLTDYRGSGAKIEVSALASANLPYYHCGKASGCG